MILEGKKAFLTGASRGIGLAIAKRFKSEGAIVMGTHTGNNQPDENICNQWVKADFSKLDDIENCVKEVLNFEPDILINNAGINTNAPFVEVDPSVFQEIQQVNVFTPMRLCQSAIPFMKKQGWGRILNISSIWGKISMEHRSAYSASKFALDGITLSLAAEHAIDGIVANSIAPGFIDTDLTRQMLGDEGIARLTSKVPARRLGKVEEIANLALWLASNENSFVNGQNIAIDGGFTRV
jgi:NAD(P)-dependent dehydrogenase (short-subunit alcohol dehydrogenase family)